MNIFSPLYPLLEALERTGWTPQTLEMWRNKGEMCLEAFTQKDTGVAHEVVQKIVKALVAGVSSPLSDHPRLLPTTVLGHPLQLMLIPSYFFQRCEEQLENWRAAQS